MNDSTVRYVSATGEAKVLLEVIRLRESDDGKTSEASVEHRHRIKVECGEFWATVHGASTAAKGWRTELTVGLADGTVVAVTEREPPGTLVAVARTVDRGLGPTDPSGYAWPDGRPVLEIRGGDGEAVVEAADGTRVVAKFGDRVGRDAAVACEVYVSDGARFRTRAEPAIEHCPGGAGPRPATGDKYLVCRRDLSGYEFVDGRDASLDRRTAACRRGCDDAIQLSPPVARLIRPQNFFPGGGGGGRGRT